jgi:hypothetical protein
MMRRAPSQFQPEEAGLAFCSVCAPAATWNHFDQLTETRRPAITTIRRLS